MVQATRKVRVGDKVRHTFTKDQVGTVVEVRNDPNGYDTKVAYRSGLDDKIYTDWYKNQVLYFDHEVEALKQPQKGTK